MKTKKEVLQEIGHRTMNLYQIEMNKLEQSSILVTQLLPATKTQGTFPSKISVLAENVLTRIRLENEAGVKKLGVLNFASPIIPGGGAFLEGIDAQEQALCRNSFLYPELLKYKKNYYLKNQQNPQHYFYSSAFIFAQNIRILRDETEQKYLPGNCLVDVVSIAAPNVTEMKRHGLQVNSAALQADFNCKVQQLLRQFKRAHERILLLGAFGCGSFGNDPRLVAQTFKTQLNAPEFVGCFEHIYFSIYQDSKALAAFSAVFAPKRIKTAAAKGQPDSE